MLHIPRGKKITNTQVSRLLPTSINVKIKSIKESFLNWILSIFSWTSIWATDSVLNNYLNLAFQTLRITAFICIVFWSTSMTQCFKRTVRKVEGKEATSTIFSILSNHFLDLILDSRLPKGRQPCKVFEVRFHRGIISVQRHDEDTYPEPSKNRTSHCTAITAL